jgi:hypothetical protein
MNRQQLRDYTRILADELTEAPEGLFGDTQLDTLINVSQDNVLLALADKLPKQFRKPALISITANKRVYDIATDLSITDFLRFSCILRNLAGEKPVPLTYWDVEDIWEVSTVGEKGTPVGWGYESRTEIFFDPTPSTTVADRFKAYYYAELPDLADDNASPALPKPAHPLISLDVLRQWNFRDEKVQQLLEERFSQMIFDVTYKLSGKEGPTVDLLPSTKELYRQSKQ